jgi:hypothetical protein
MGSLAAFKTAYLASTVVPTPQRERLAGPVYNIERLVADGNTVTAARQLTTKRSLIDVHKAQLVSNPYQSTLAADFYALDAA